MTKKLTLVLPLFLFFSGFAFGQEEKQIRLNVLNPGIAWETPTGKTTTLEINVGIGYNGSYPELNTMFGENGFQGQIAPFLDVQGRKYYNLDKVSSGSRKSKKFVALRYLFYGPRIAGNVRTNENYSMAVGPTWGFKRDYERWTLLGSLGPVYYFDLTGSDGWLPINFEINFGYRLNNKKRQTP
ncbi:hypothetical protein [Algoriphagus confluentis]|uniref:DUF3575 domain-containing protein n=1 Tax=Algoriphagus confluentis TaxID=1697556 RepID=A0ABQ6PPR9_9BACT|nr:hypothetical protein Aconfl_26020 [Algoriphagus confluentis]